MDVDFADCIVLLANTPLQAEFLLHRLVKVAGGTGLHINADITEYIYFNQNQKEEICTLKGGSLKLVDMFTYLGSSVSSTENGINI